MKTAEEKAQAKALAKLQPKNAEESSRPVSKRTRQSNKPLLDRVQAAHDEQADFETRVFGFRQRQKQQAVEILEGAQRLNAKSKRWSDNADIDVVIEEVERAAEVNWELIADHVKIAEGVTPEVKDVDCEEEETK